MMQDAHLKLQLGLSWQNQHSTRRSYFHQPTGLAFRNKLVKRYIWSIAWYGVGTWTLRKVDHKYAEKISSADRMKKMKYDEESRKRRISHTYIKKKS
jgi:hypothetical protein